MRLIPELAAVQLASDRIWDGIWQNCDFATFFHSRAWASVWSRYDPTIQPDARLLSFSDGAKILAPLCAQRRCNGLYTTYQSSPAGTYGGWLTADNIAPEHALTADEYMRSKLENLELRVNPFNQYSGFTVAKEVKADETFAIELNGDFESAKKQWSHSHVLGMKKALKTGVTVRIASTEADWAAYYDIYEDSLRRWADDASARYGWELFRLLASENDPNIELRLAEVDGKPVSGIILLYSKNHVVAWHMATLEEYFKVHPPVLLMAESLKDAYQKGLRWFDFNPSGWHEGVRTFKRRFGAQELSCPVLTSESRWARLTENVAITVKRAIR